MAVLNLTEAERKFLDLCAEGVVDATFGHAEAEALAEAGLVTIQRHQPSPFIAGIVVTITPAGREALAQTKE